MVVNGRTGQTAMVNFAAAGGKSQEHQGPSRSVWEAIFAFVVLVIVTAEALWFSYILGRLAGWELAVTIFTVLAVAAGLIYTVLWISQPHGPDGR